MQCFSAIECTLNVRDLADLKRKIRGQPRNSSPIVSLLNKKEFTNLIKLSLQILKVYALILATYQNSVFIICLSLKSKRDMLAHKF